MDERVPRERRTLVESRAADFLVPEMHAVTGAEEAEAVPEGVVPRAAPEREMQRVKVVVRLHLLEQPMMLQHLRQSDRARRFSPLDTVTAVAEQVPAKEFAPAVCRRIVRHWTIGFSAHVRQ